MIYFASLIQGKPGVRPGGGGSKKSAGGGGSKKCAGQDQDWHTSKTPDELKQEQALADALLASARELFVSAHESRKEYPLEPDRAKAALDEALQFCHAIDLRSRDMEEDTIELKIWLTTAILSYHFFCSYFVFIFKDSDDTSNPDGMPAWSASDWRAFTDRNGVQFGIEAYLRGKKGAFNYANYLSARGQYIAAYESKLPTGSVFMKIFGTLPFTAKPFFLEAHAPCTERVHGAAHTHDAFRSISFLFSFFYKNFQSAYYHPHSHSRIYYPLLPVHCRLPDVALVVCFEDQERR